MIDSFNGDWKFLSNFHPSSIECVHRTLGRVDVPTAEHAFAAAKTLDERMALRIIGEPTPGRAKRLGRRCELRQDWEEIKISVMHSLVTLKFHQNPSLALQLRLTCPHDLIEGNTWGDEFWGVCEGRGENWLGRILMDIRQTV